MALVAMRQSAGLHDKLLLRQGALRLPAEIQAEAMIEVVSSIYYHGLRALDADQLLEASKAFAEIERPLTEAEQLSRRAGCTLATLVRFDELRSSVAQHAYLAQARLAIQKGDGFIQRALDSLPPAYSSDAEKAVVDAFLDTFGSGVAVRGSYGGLVYSWLA